MRMRQSDTVRLGRARLLLTLLDGFEQGVAKRRLAVEELFAPETLERAKI